MRIYAGSRRGFSLIELLVVLSMIALATAAVSIRWSSMYQRARLRADVDRFIDIDGKTRQHAMARAKACQLVFDIDRQTIRSSRWIDGAEKLRTFSMSTQTRLAGLFKTKIESDRNQAVIVVDSSGASQTYSVHLLQQDEPRWIVFAGRTGQASVYDEKEEFEKAYHLLVGKRPDFN